MVTNVVVEFLNKLVFVAPIYGYGWQLIESESPRHSDISAMPSPFRLRILEFFYVDEIPTVACGRIEDNAHLLRNYWVALIPTGDEPDDGKGIVACGTLICPSKPEFDPTFRPVNHAKVVSSQGVPRYRGISMVAKGTKFIADEILQNYLARWHDQTAGNSQ